MRFLVLTLLFIFAGSVSVNAQDRVEGIVAVVNDDIITASDLFERFELIASSSGLPNNQEVRDRFLPQILNVLINERLQLQEAGRLEIAVTDEDVERGIEGVAAQNNQDPEAFIKMLQARNLPVNSLKEQIRAQIAWQRVIAKSLRPQIEVTQQDIDGEEDRLMSNAGKPEYRVAEIFLPVEDSNAERRVRSTTGRIVTELANKKANFAALARQFSQNASASNGGNLGWVFADQLPEEVAKELATMSVGAVSRPIKTLSGYHIILLQDKRVFRVASDVDIKVDLKQIFLPYGDRDEDDVVEEAQQLATEIGGCLSISEHYGSYDNDQTGDMGIVSVAQAPEFMTSRVRNMAIAEISEPLQTEEGVYLIMVCDRQAPQSNMPSEDDIANAIGQERLDVLQRRHLLDLRATAFIERRV